MPFDRIAPVYREPFMRFFFSLSLLVLLVLLSVADAWAADATTVSPLEPFLKHDVFGTIEISPTGEYFAVSAPLDDRTSLVILRRSDMTMISHVTFEKNVHVEAFEWVSPSVVLFSIAKKFGSLAQPLGTGEIFRLDISSKTPDHATALIGMGAAWSEFLDAKLVDGLPNDDDSVLVSFGAAYGESEVDRMNTRNGSRKMVARVSATDASFVTDAGGAVRFATGHDQDGYTQTYYRADDGADWQLVNDESATGRIVTPQGFNADGKLAYLQIEEKTGPDAVYAFDTATHERKLILRDDNVDPSEYFYSPIDGSLYAVGFQDGTPRVEYVDPESPFAKLHRDLQANFAGQAVVPLTFTKDGNFGLFLVYSDRVPGDFYLFDRASNQATYIASKNSWFKPEMLNPMRPVALKARDGTELQGFLTVPKDSSGKNLPLVINPHGGPFREFDQWGYSPEVQLLADHGYAVLQINYRGSGNYGRAFALAGYTQWGGTMQDDLTDATRWAIAQGIADAKRICIYGASYGGYAALMGVAKEPDLYRCAVGNVGVYDMATMYRRGYIAQTDLGKKLLAQSLGKQNLAAISPNLLADRIKVPVMLAAGEEDERAPPVHTKKMRDALLALGKPVETTIYDHEGHGNYLMKNKIDFYSKLLAFLDKYIGPAAVSPGK
jgi:dipeptidyl aminopeptidase/acylaminoacyl peptidase